ncbi:MAG: hypothetical protein RL564_1346 [Pseudomonadota bacterium]
MVRASRGLHGVQGVASSNPAAPTNQIKDLGQPTGWPFCFFWLYLEKVPNKVPNEFQTYQREQKGDVTVSMGRIIIQPSKKVEYDSRAR